METPSIKEPHDPVHLAYLQGRNMGLATAALALSLVSFVNLLGIEKSILAAVLAIFALRGRNPAAQTARRSRITLIFAGIHAVTFIVVVALFHEKLAELIHLLQKLS